MNKPLAVCFQVIFFFSLLMSVSTGMANQSSRDVLERSWQRYVEACRSGEEARVKEAISAYNFAATKNKYPMFGGPIPADTVKGLIAYAPDLNEVTNCRHSNDCADGRLSEYGFPLDVRIYPPACRLLF